MATVQLHLGPADHGRPLSEDDFQAAEYEPGHRYELIAGRLYVSPEADFAEDWIGTWLLPHLFAYANAQPNVVNYVGIRSRIFVPSRRLLTCPQPDFAMFRNVPTNRNPRDINWRELSPLVVIEILYQGDAHKDLVRNVELYHQVPSIREYWLLDARDDPEQPTLLAHRRYGARWRIKTVRFGETYTTRLLPGFSLLIDPRR